jgi:hypothetical protein
MLQIKAPHIPSRNVMIVLALTAAILLIAVPFLAEKRTKSSLQRAASMISNQVQLTRQKAMASESDYRISYDYKAQVFRVYRHDPPGRWTLDPPENYFLLPQGVILSPASKPEDGAISITASGDVIAVDEVLLRLSDDYDNKLSIRVSKAGHIQELSTWK